MLGHGSHHSRISEDLNACLSTIRKYLRLAIISGLATLPSLFSESLRSARAADDGLQVSIQTLLFQFVQCHNKYIKHQVSLCNCHHATHPNELLKFTTQQIFVQLSPKFTFLKEKKKEPTHPNCVNTLIPINFKGKYPLHTFLLF